MRRVRACHLQGPDSALRAEVAENHEAEAEAANDHAIEEQAFDDEPEHENEEALKEDDGKIFDSTLQSFDEDGESNADEENFDEADDNDAIEERRRPESKRGSRRLSTRPAKGASKKRGSKKGSKSRKGKARRRKNPRRRKMRKLAKRLRKYLKRKQRKAGKQSANKVRVCVCVFAYRDSCVCIIPAYLYAYMLDDACVGTHLYESMVTQSTNSVSSGSACACMSSPSLLDSSL